MFSKKVVFSMILLIFFVILAAWPLLRSGFFVTDDGDWMVIRLSAFHETLKTGQFPVRYLERLNHGYGYPVLNFLYPLPFYAGEMIHIFGPGFELSVKLLFILSFFLSALSMYLYAKSKWGSFAGLCAAIVYIYLPYRMFDVYKRGSLGESVAFIFIPLVFYYLDKFCRSDKKIDLALGALSYSLLVLSHNVVAFIVSLGLGLYVIVKSGYERLKFDVFYKSSLMLVFGLIISAFFWLPAIYDLQYTRAASVAVADYRNYFLDSKSLFNFLGPGGIILILIAFVQMFRKKDFVIAAMLSSLILILLLTNSTSDFVWTLGLLPKLVQFPWRFLSLGVFLLALIAGYLSSKINSLAVIVTTVLVVIWGIININPVRTFHPDAYYSTNDDSTTVRNEYMPRWIKNDPTSRAKSYLEILKGEARLVGENEIDVSTKAIVRINRVFFPGIVVKINNVSSPFEYLQDGLIKISLQPGKYSIKTTFEETPIRLFSDFVSLAGFILCSIIIVKFVKK